MRRLIRTLVAGASLAIVGLVANNEAADAMMFPCYACVDTCTEPPDNQQCYEQCRMFFAEACAGPDPSGFYCEPPDIELIECYETQQ